MKGILVKRKVCGMTTGGRYHISKERCFSPGDILHVASRREGGNVLVVEESHGGLKTEIFVPLNKDKYKIVDIVRDGFKYKRKE